MQELSSSSKSSASDSICSWVWICLRNERAVAFYFIGSSSVRTLFSVCSDFSGVSCCSICSSFELTISAYSTFSTVSFWLSPASALFYLAFSFHCFLRFIFMAFLLSFLICFAFSFSSSFSFSSCSCSYLCLRFSSICICACRFISCRLRFK